MATLLTLPLLRRKELALLKMHQQEAKLTAPFLVRMTVEKANFAPGVLKDILVSIVL